MVIHSISLPPKKYNTDHIEKFFMNELDFRLDDFYKEIDGLKVSSHVLIKRTGEIIQFVPFNKEPGMLVYPHIKEEMTAMIFQ